MLKRIRQQVGNLEWQLRSMVQLRQAEGAIVPGHPAARWADNFDNGVKRRGAAGGKGQP